MAPPVAKKSEEPGSQGAMSDFADDHPIAIAEEGSSIWEQILPERLKLTSSVSCGRILESHASRHSVCKQRHLVVGSVELTELNGPLAR